MKKIIPVFLFALFIVSCTTMPPEIEDKYLVQKSDTDTKKISNLEEKIIVKNREKQETENKLRNQAKLPEGIHEEIKLLEKENDTLKDQVYLYEKNKDAVNLELKKKQLSDNEAILKKKKAEVEYSQSEKRMFETELDLKNAELAQLIAELNFEKSNIAAAYRDKNDPPKPDKKQNFFDKLLKRNDPNDKYGYKKYSEYLNKKKEETTKAEKEYKDASNRFQNAKAKLEKLK